MAQHYTNHNETPYFLKAIHVWCAVCAIFITRTQSDVNEFLSSAFSQYNTLSEVTICCVAPGVANTSLAQFRTLEQYIKKVKCTPVQALRLCTGRTAHRGSRGIAVLFLDHSTRRGERSASRPDRSLSLGKTRYPLYRRLGGPQGLSEQVRKISAPPGFDPRTVQPVANRYTDYTTRPLGAIHNTNCYLVTYCQLHIPTGFVCSFS